MRPYIITLVVLLLFQQGYCQRSTITVGPVLTLGKHSLNNDRRKGYGFGMEITHRLLANGAARLYIGKETLHTPGRPQDDVDYLSLRTGYQLYLLSRKFTGWGDAGIVLYHYPGFATRGSLSVSAGGGYNFWVARIAIAQAQLFYTYNLRADPFNNKTAGGWITLRTAIGLGIGSKPFKKKARSG